MNTLYLPDHKRISSEVSTDSDSFTQKPVSAKKSNPRLENFRNSIKTSLFSANENPSLQSARTLPTPLTAATDSRASPDSVDEYKLEKRHEKRSSAYVNRMDKFRTTVKSNLLMLSQKSSSISPQNKEFLSAELPITNMNVIKPYSLPDTGSELDDSSDSHPGISRKESQNLVIEVMESRQEPTLRAQVSKSEDTGKGEIIEELSFPRHKGSIFYDSIENQVQDLKIELGITDDPHIHFFTGSFSVYFKEEEVLGEGTSGVVKRCMKVDTGESFAVKIVQYRGDNEILMLIINEFAHLRKLNHKNIIKVYELYVDYFKKKIYTVMELSECREMFEVLKDLGHYSEAVASGIFKQILTGINYLHLNGVCHRDIKPNNILVSKDGKTVKITDFNVSKFLDKKQGQKKYSSFSNENYRMWTYTGTIAFTAPEVFLDSEYTECVDVWSAGVVLYTMLCGYQPFQAENVQDLIELIKNGKYEFHPPEWSNISDQAKKLVKHCLDINLKTRFTPSDALMHSWIANQGVVSDIKISNIRDNFRVYYKKYTGKKDLACTLGMKKMQVTSPNLSVTALRKLQLKKRSGTINFTSSPMKFSPVIQKAQINRPSINEEKDGEFDQKELEQEQKSSKSSIQTIDSKESLEELTLEKSVSSGVVETIKSCERTLKAIQERIDDRAAQNSAKSSHSKNGSPGESVYNFVDRSLINSAVVGGYCIHEGSDEDSADEQEQSRK